MINFKKKKEVKSSNPEVAHECYQQRRPISQSVRTYVLFIGTVFRSFLHLETFIKVGVFTFADSRRSLVPQ